jgi:tetratricopeptide (TPR) repeat protein
VVFEGILSKSPLPPSQLAAGVTPDFDRVVARALEKDRETRYQSAADLRADLKRLSRATESGPAAAAAPAVAAAPPAPAAASAVHASSPAAPAARSRLAWRPGAPAVTVAVVAGVVLWRSSATPALTEADSVVLADFTNRTGDAMFDGALGEALGGQLRQSTFLKLYPEQQIQATQRLMGRDPMSPIPPDVARDLCQRLGGKAVLGGAISAVGSSYLLTLNAQDCVTGAIVAEEQVQAPNKDGVLKALGEAASAFRGRLGESLASIQRTDTRIEMATTPSLDALKAYSEGMTTRRIKGDFDSIPFFKRALELDDTFALAHARISTVYSNVGDQDLSKRHSTRAYELRERVSDRERYYIEARYYTTVEPDPDKAMDAYRRLLAAYPGDYAAHANLASLQRQQGQLDAAIANYEAAMKVAPDQPLAAQNAGYAYIDGQRYDDARRLFERALSLQDATPTRNGLFTVGILTGDQALADAQVQAMRGRRDEVSIVGLRIQALTYQGRFKEAAELTPQFLRMMEQAQRGQFSGEALVGVAIAEAVVGFDDRARARLADLRRRKLVTEASADERMVLAFILRDAALAREALPETLKLAAASPPQFREENERAFRAMDAMAAGDAKKSLALLEPVTMDGPRTRVVIVYAEALIDAGRGNDAVPALQWLLSKDARLGIGVSKAHAMATLGRQLAGLGRTAEARKVYDELFAFWSAADPDVPMLIRAKVEYSKLGS